jgi:hypothetical protein
MKAAKPTGEEKTPGDMAGEKHRPLMSRLTEVQRGKQRQRAAELLCPHGSLAFGLRAEGSE